MPGLPAVLLRNARRRIGRGLLALLCLPAWAAAAPAADDPALPFYRRASSCAAVMKQDVLGLAARYRGGERALRADIQQLTELTFTFVGTAYKRGLRSAQADALMAEAEAQQHTQAAAVLRQLSADCQGEGARLLAKSNILERALVRNRAKARVDQLLADPKP